MRFRIHRLGALCVLSCVAATSCIYAHEVTLFPEVNADSITLAARYGDPGQYEKIYKIKLLSFNAISPDGQTSSILPTVKTDPDELSLISSLHLKDGAKGTWTFASTYDNGFYVHAADGHAIATTLADYPAAVDSAHYFKFSKALLHIGRSSSGFDRVLGHRLELIPNADPFAVAVGGSLPVTVYFEGKPLANATVEIGDDKSAGRSPEQKTDSKGVVQVPVDHRGWYRLAVTYRATSHYPALFKYDDLTASLVFQND
jgi:nickel transport protein